MGLGDALSLPLSWILPSTLLATHTRILDLAKLFVVDAPMKKKIKTFSVTPSRSILKYWSENNPLMRGLKESWPLHKSQFDLLPNNVCPKIIMPQVIFIYELWRKKEAEFQKYLYHIKSKSRKNVNNTAKHRKCVKIKRFSFDSRQFILLFFVCRLFILMNSHRQPVDWVPSFGLQNLLPKSNLPGLFF